MLTNVLMNIIWLLISACCRVKNLVLSKHFLWLEPLARHTVLPFYNYLRGLTTKRGLFFEHELSKLASDVNQLLVKAALAGNEEEVKFFTDRQNEIKEILSKNSVDYIHYDTGGIDTSRSLFQYGK